MPRLLVVVLKLAAPLEKRALAPDPGAVKVTVALGTGLFDASCTVATKNR